MHINICTIETTSKSFFPIKQVNFLKFCTNNFTANLPCIMVMLHNTPVKVFHFVQEKIIGCITQLQLVPVLSTREECNTSAILLRWSAQSLLIETLQMKYTSVNTFLKMHYREPLLQTILKHNVFSWEHIGLIL